MTPIYFFKNQFKKLLFNLSASNNSFYNSIVKSLYKPKKGTLAEILDEFSRTYSGVTFIQVGANDGFFHDPLHKFIRMYKWNGVLLEPQPYVFESFLKRLYRNTPGVYPVNAALASEDGVRDIFKISFSNLRWATGLTSFNRSALESAIRSGHVERLAKRYGEKLPDDKNHYIATEKVQSISPATLIKKYNLKKIDWLQIDAEGFDYEIVKMMDIKNTQPKVIVYENSHLSAEDQARCVDLLSINNYQVTHIQENTVAMRKPLGVFEKYFVNARR